MRANFFISGWLALGSIFTSVYAQPLRLTINPSQQPIQLGIFGQAGGQYVLEQSSNPGAPNSWQFLLSLTLNSTSQNWIDSSSTTAPIRFYRLRSVTGPSTGTASNFRLIDQDGVSRELYYNTSDRANVLIFTDGLGTVAPSTLAAIKSIRNDFATPDIQFWMIDANPQSNRSTTAALASASGIDWPVLHDRAQLVTREYGVTSVPEVVCIDASDWSVFYRGAIEGQPTAPGYLGLALKSFLSGQTVAFNRTRADGQAVQLEPVKSASYSTDIAPLLQEKCVRCHSPGNIAPWTMSDYSSVQKYSASIKSQVLTTRMPPWHADPIYGTFSNDVSLKPAEAATLVKWIADGAPRGDGADPLADLSLHNPPPTNYPYAWPAELGQPDYIISIPKQQIPATGEVPYKYPQVTAAVPSNIWLRAAVILPGNARSVHHALVFTGSIADILRSGGGLGGFFAGYVPGQRAQEFPSGTGKFLAKNTTITFQMHYTTTGQAETDQTRIGLYYMKSPPPRELQTRAAATIDLSIPAYAQEYEREAQFMPSATTDVMLYELAPHMHYRGSRFKFEALYPDGTSEVLLSVPKYDFHWQTLYRLAEPKRLPAGTIVRCRGAFDNSPLNLDNPAPSVAVSFGEQTDDEMFIGYLNYAEIR